MIMLLKDFIERRNEMASLRSRVRRPGFEFKMLTERRRVGKTRLLYEFSMGMEPIFLMCEKRKWKYNLERSIKS